jgi:hypothetical protein
MLVEVDLLLHQEKLTHQVMVDKVVEVMVLEAVQVDQELLAQMLKLTQVEEEVDQPLVHQMVLCQVKVVKE